MLLLFFGASLLLHVVHTAFMQATHTTTPAAASAAAATLTTVITAAPTCYCRLWRSEIFVQSVSATPTASSVFVVEVPALGQDPRTRRTLVRAKDIAVALSKIPGFWILRASSDSTAVSHCASFDATALARAQSPLLEALFVVSPPPPPQPLPSSLPKTESMDEGEGMAKKNLIAVCAEQ